MQRDKMPNRDIDIIDTNRDDETLVIQVFDKIHHLIKNNAVLNVKNEEEAVFCDRDKIADRFLSGEYILNEKSLPVLSALQGWKYDSNNPFDADIYFVSTQQFLDQHWKTICLMSGADQTTEKTEIRLSGIFSFQIANSDIFVLKYMENRQMKDTSYLGRKIETYLSGSLSTILQNADVEIEFLYRETNKISEIVLELLSKTFSEDGINLLSFQITNVFESQAITGNEDREDTTTRSRDPIDLEELTRIKAEKEANAAYMPTRFEAMSSEVVAQGILKVAETEDVEKESAESVNEVQVHENESSSNAETKDVALVSYYVAMDNKQAGPFENAILTQLYLDGKLKKGSLVWTKGLLNWQVAETQKNLDFIWETIIPPLPEN